MTCGQMSDHLRAGYEMCPGIMGLFGGCLGGPQGDALLSSVTVNLGALLHRNSTFLAGLKKLQIGK